ncbi:MAG: phosphoribosyl-ATP diphosphatase [Alphaproteobacteria bacterium]|nr:phosphoribosyl-ATP diphosphatase [Alphaproteobacteria bacterium]
MDTLSTLYQTLLDRKNSEAQTSYVASLYKKGTPGIVNKVIEEAVETGVEAMGDHLDKLASESADLLFHLMVLWAHKGITPQDVFSVLESRAGISGHTEKKSR